MFPKTEPPFPPHPPPAHIHTKKSEKTIITDLQLLAPSNQLCYRYCNMASVSCFWITVLNYYYRISTCHNHLLLFGHFGLFYTSFQHFALVLNCVIINEFFFFFFALCQFKWLSLCHQVKVNDSAKFEERSTNMLLMVAFWTKKLRNNIDRVTRVTEWVWYWWRGASA